MLGDGGLPIHTLISWRRTIRVAILPVLALVPGSSAHGQGATPAVTAGLVRAEPEDYRTGVGRMVNGALVVTFEAGLARWQPWGSDGPSIATHVYATDGGEPRTPGPMLRARVGTPVHVTIRNTLADTLIMRGLVDRGAIPPAAPPFSPFASDSVVVPPGGEGEVRFTPTVPGTFVYFGKTVGPGESASVPTPLPVRSADRSLWGVLIVDPADYVPTSPAERIFLITHWADPSRPGTFLPATRFFVNGASWPHTERLEYAQGDTVRWRVINVTGRVHPMHLHGAHFSVDARGTQLRETLYPPAERRLGVTETLDIAETMRVSWVAHEPGNWLFHCHFMRHMSWLQASPPDAVAHRHVPPGAEGEDLLGGLVLGVHVAPAPSHQPAPEPARRAFDLHITRRAGVFGSDPAYSFVLAEGSVAPAADSVRFPGSLIVMRRGEPTEVRLRNRSDVAIGVHWHGLELESRWDGVPGWSGMRGQTVPAVLPGGELMVRMTPPRPGTFMYHVHSEPGHQLAQGLYGPLIVLDRDEAWNPETDRLFLLGSLGSGEDAPAAVNGALTHPPLSLTSGRSYRLRFMHISPDDTKRVLLSRGETPVMWQAVARDGADLPPTLAQQVRADLRINVGETYDFRWNPEPGDYVLRVVTTFDQGVAAFRREAPPPHTLDIAINVR